MNLFKCVFCKTIITSEELNEHKCKSHIKKYKTILASSYFTVKENNDEYVLIDGLDGIGYRFIIKEPKIMPMDLPYDTAIRRSFTGTKSDGDLTAPVRANWGKRIIFSRYVVILLN